MDIEVQDEHEKDTEIKINKRYDDTAESNEEPVIFREKNPEESMALWYWIVGILAVVAILWYGFSAGWFGMRDTLPLVDNSQQVNEIDASNFAEVDSLRIEPGDGFPIEQTLVVSGNLQDGCVYLNDPLQTRDGNIFYVTLDTRTEGDVCTEALVPYERYIPLQVNNLPADVYIVVVNREREITFELEGDNVLDFGAGSDK